MVERGHRNCCVQIALCLRDGLRHRRFTSVRLSCVGKHRSDLRADRSAADLVVELYGLLEDRGAILLVGEREEAGRQLLWHLLLHADLRRPRQSGAPDGRLDFAHGDSLHTDTERER